LVRWSYWFSVPCIVGWLSLWFGLLVGLVRLLGTLVSGLAVCWFGLFFTGLRVGPV